MRMSAKLTQPGTMCTTKSNNADLEQAALHCTSPPSHYQYNHRTQYSTHARDLQHRPDGTRHKRQCCQSACRGFATVAVGAAVGDENRDDGRPALGTIVN